MKILPICVRRGCLFEREKILSWSGMVGNYFLGIIFYCHQSGFEGDPSLYSPNATVRNGWLLSTHLTKGFCRDNISLS